SPGTTREVTSAVGRAPIAATSARFCAAARRPTSYPVDQRVRKCRSSTSTSVDTTKRPSGAASTAASSPGPSSVAPPRGSSGTMRSRIWSSERSRTRDTGRPYGLVRRAAGYRSTVRAARSVARAETRSETRPPSRPAVGPARVAGTTAAAALAVAGLTGCAPTIGVEVAPHAADPACAEVMLAVPDELGDDLPKVQTDSQATAAWGEPGGAVTMRCGVEQLGPSADCQHVDSGNGTTVDWIVT